MRSPAGAPGQSYWLILSCRSTTIICRSVRRKFFDVHAATASPIAKEALDRIGQLYAVEKTINVSPPDRRRQERQRRSKPIAEALSAWAESTARQLSRKSELAEWWSGLRPRRDILSERCSRVGFAADSPLEEAGFEPSVPRRYPASRARRLPRKCILWVPGSIRPQHWVCPPLVLARLFAALSFTPTGGRRKPSLRYAISRHFPDELPGQ